MMMLWCIIFSKVSFISGPLYHNNMVTVELILSIFAQLFARHSCTLAISIIQGDLVSFHSCHFSVQCSYYKWCDSIVSVISMSFLCFLGVRKAPRLSCSCCNN